MSAPVLTQLAEELRACPTGLEVLVRREASLADYLTVLERAYGFHAPLESMLGLASCLATQPLDLRGRAKAGRLAADLLGLGLRPADITALPLARDVPGFASTAEALGWMYVAERTTLGFELARAHVQRLAAGRTRAVPTAYLTSDRGDAAPRWQALCAEIVRAAPTSTAIATILRAARQAARCHTAWVEPRRSRWTAHARSG